MSRRARHHPAASRRTRRAEQPPAAATLAESPKVVSNSNPIFRCEAEPKPSQPKTPAPGDQLRCVYRPGSLYALVHDPAAAVSDGIGKTLPLPPCRTHRAGSHVPALQVGSALVASCPHGRVRRRAPPQDPFLAAYVACSKSNGKDDAAGVDRRQQKQRQGRKKTTKAKKKKDGKEGEEVVRGCGIWSGWAAGAKYAGAMSCRHGCAVAEQQQGDTPVAVEKKEAGEEDAAAGPTLDLSWAPVVLSARVLERRREQR